MGQKTRTISQENEKCEKGRLQVQKRENQMTKQMRREKEATQEKDKRKQEMERT